MQKRFPELIAIQVIDGVLFRGRFIIEAKHDDFIIQKAPLLELFIPENYPLNFPQVKDIDDVITYDHKFINGDLCVSTMFDLQLKLIDSKCISDYIDYFLIPYFISYEYWKDNNIDVFGDREHSIGGVFESIQDFFCIPKDNYPLFKTLICWASGNKKFKKCVQLLNQSIYKKNTQIKLEL